MNKDNEGTSALAQYVVSLDQGTTSSRALLFDTHGEVKGVAQQAYDQYFPQPGWVEHEPFDILGSQLAVFRQLLAEHGLSAQNIAGIGITNQRETTIVWDARTGMPFGRAIVWQCRRTTHIVESLCSSSDVRERITETTGLIADAYFSASKIKWILDNVDGAREAAEAGFARFGTVDTWLIYNLTGGAVHATDFTNASRTMLFDIHKGEWDPWLCELFGIPQSMLPDVRPSAGNFGKTATSIAALQLTGACACETAGAFVNVFEGIPAGIPICGVAGDQQSALFGHLCIEPGQAKNTYGTGCFLLMHTGTQAVRSANNLVTTIVASPPSADGTFELEYALEGSVFVAGALIQWLRDELGIIETAEESEELAMRVPDTAGVYVVPAFTGLGAPYWDADARGAFFGLTRGTKREHVVRACLESLAYQTADLAHSMEEDCGIRLEELEVDGGAARNNFLMQFQADILKTTINRPANVEVTAVGAAYLAGLSCGFWDSVDAIRQIRVMDAQFSPTMKTAEREELLAGWAACVARTRSTQ